MNQPLFLIDNTALISFALIGHLPILPSLLNRQGRICASVEGEANRHANFNSTDLRLQPLTTVGQLFSPVITADVNEMVRTSSLRQLLASPGEGPTKHLGEAETLAVIEGRYQRNAKIVTDDFSARRLAANLGIEAATTLGLLQWAYNTHVLTVEELQKALQTLARENRPAPPPHTITSLGAVHSWAEPL